MKKTTLIFFLCLSYVLIACGANKSASSSNEKKHASELDSESKISKTENILYETNGVSMRGYVAYPNELKEGEKRPGILVVHEWWGQNEYARHRARKLAKLGYVAMAIDMYGDGKVAAHPKEAGVFSKAAKENFTEFKQKFIKALIVLQKNPRVDSNQTAAIGYCFGGYTVLNMAMLNLGLKGVVSFHGSLNGVKPPVNRPVTTQVLVCHGEADDFISKEDIEAFKKMMTSHQINYQFKSYQGAKHSFTNPMADEAAKKFGIGVAYNEDADKASWEEMKAFFGGLFSPY